MTSPAALVIADKALEDGRDPRALAVEMARAGTFDADTLAELAELLTPRTNKYIPWQPSETQAAFLLLDCKEALYGGAAGGGKSVALLTAALQYVDVPGYHALLLRRTFAALSKPGALIDLAHEWLRNTDATWNEQRKQWTFPSGATLSFGYCDTDNDRYQYQGAAYHFVGFDELTQFTRVQYTYLFSRCRRRSDGEAATVPLRVRAASNPGGEGHAWVKERFIDRATRKPGAVFIPARLDDNPHLDKESYREMLAELSPVEREQLEHGSWEAAKPGDWFKAEWWQYIDASALPLRMRKVRYWDTASTDDAGGRKDPDWYAGVLMGEHRGVFYVLDVVRFRHGPAETELELEKVIARDGPDVEVWMAQEPGSQSKLLINAYARGLFKGYTFRGDRQTGDKVQRAKPLSAAVHNKLVKLVRGAWNRDFTDELEAFPAVGVHDDQVDAASGAHSKLARGVGRSTGAAVAPLPVASGMGGM